MAKSLLQVLFTPMDWIGYVGVVAFALAWIPQSWDTVRAGTCEVNLLFLALSAVGSAALALYALLKRDPVFAILNTMTTLGALVNVRYRLFPRRRASKPSVAHDRGQKPQGHQSRQDVAGHPQR